MHGGFDFVAEVRLDCPQICGDTFMATIVGAETSFLSRANRGQRDLSIATRLHDSSRVNVGKLEREVSLAAGIGATLLGVVRRDVPGLLMAALGAGLIYRGASDPTLNRRSRIDTSWSNGG